MRSTRSVAMPALPAALAAAVAAVSAAHGATLWDVYALAVDNDPTFATAEATYRAALENKPIALSAYLPNIGATAQRQIDRSSGEVPLTYDPATNAYIESNGRFRSYTTSYAAQLTQPIFNWSAWQSIRQADATVAQAQALYVAAQQDLLVRTASAYFDVVTARDTLAADHAAAVASGRELDQSKAKYRAGSGTVTDVQNAQAAYDQTVATEIASRQAIINAEESLRAITGRPAGPLLGPVVDLPLRSPDPVDAGRWVATALAQNPNLKAAEAAADAASRNVAIKRSGHFPTLDLVFSHNYSRNDQYSTIQNLQLGQFQSITGNSVMLQLNVPIYSGGAVHAQVSQAEYQYRAAEDQVRFARRAAVQQARTAYLGVLTDISQVEALRQSVKSSATSLQFMEAGMRIGTRTIVDVALARQNLVAAQTSYAQSREHYLTSLLALKRAAGILAPVDLKRMSALLQVPAPATDVDAEAPR
jgi:outer membrane protein